MSGSNNCIYYTCFYASYTTIGNCQCLDTTNACGCIQTSSFYCDCPGIYLGQILTGCLPNDYVCALDTRSPTYFPTSPSASQDSSSSSGSPSTTQLAVNISIPIILLVIWCCFALFRPKIFITNAFVYSLLLIPVWTIFFSFDQYQDNIYDIVMLSLSTFLTVAFLIVQFYFPEDELSQKMSKLVLDRVGHIAGAVILGGLAITSAAVVKNDDDYYHNVDLLTVVFFCIVACHIGGIIWSTVQITSLAQKEDVDIVKSAVPENRKSATQNPLSSNSARV